MADLYNIFGNGFADFLSMLDNQKNKDCCVNCIHYYEDGRARCRLLKDTRPYPRDDKCMLYARKKN